MKPTTGAVLSILSTLLQNAHGQHYNSYVSFGANSSAPQDGYQTYQKAARLSNESHAVAFEFDNTQQQNWTWTLKIVDVHMANITGTNLDTLQPNPPPDPNVAFTTYDFSWPGDQGLNQAVAEGENLNSPITTSNPSCMYMIWAQFPLNVSKKYDPSSSDCTSAFGDKCVGAILAGMSGSTGCETSGFPSYFEYKDECQDSWGAIEGGSWATQAYAFGNATAPKNQTGLSNGGTFAWVLSDPYTEGNSSAFHMETERLRVIGLSSGGQNQLLCNRIAATVDSGALPTAKLGGLAMVSVIAMVVAVVNGM